jgi:hypothetical protein
MEIFGNFPSGKTCYEHLELVDLLGMKQIRNITSTFGETRIRLATKRPVIVTEDSNGFPCLDQRLKICRGHLGPRLFLTHHSPLISVLRYINKAAEKTQSNGPKLIVCSLNGRNISVRSYRTELEVVFAVFESSESKVNASQVW